MEYTIQRLAGLSGVSTRTLRYYDELGLLSPVRKSNGYRIYGEGEVKRLQQILLYRAMELPLGEIKKLIFSPDFDEQAALRRHLTGLLEKRAKIDAMIRNVEQTMDAAKGVGIMRDAQRFQGLKEGLVAENEEKYGQEIRKKYGEEAVDRANAKLRGMTPEDYQRMEALSQELNETLKAAFEQGDPTSDLAQKACGLHKEWLCCYWDSYSREAHLGVTQMYAEDPRFGAYYDQIAVGCGVFLRDAVRHYCGQ